MIIFFNMSIFMWSLQLCWSATPVAGYSLAVRFSLSALEPLAFTQMILPGLQIHIVYHFDLTCKNQPALTVFRIDLG